MQTEYGTWDKRDHAPFEELKGKTIAEIEGAEVGSEQITFRTSDGVKYTLTYWDDCCASCSIEDIAGDIQDLIGSEILLAEEVSSNEPDPVEKARREKEKAEIEAKGGYYSGHKSETWTFYKLATIKGSVTLRWYGSSNGYYSEWATFERWKS